MKKIMLLGLAIALSLSACNQEKRYTQQSPEIDSYKKVIAAYEKQNWDEMATQYSDSAKIMNNTTKENAQTVAQLIEQNKQDAALFTSWRFIPKTTEYEMVLTDDKETWVNFWGHWEGTLKANKKTYVIPCAITVQFVDGKIVREDGYWDVSKLVADMQKLQSAAPEANTAVDDKTKE